MAVATCSVSDLEMHFSIRTPVFHESVLLER